MIFLPITQIPAPICLSFEYWVSCILISFVLQVRLAQETFFFLIGFTNQLFKNSPFLVYYFKHFGFTQSIICRFYSRMFEIVCASCKKYISRWRSLTFSPIIKHTVFLILNHQIKIFYSSSSILRMQRVSCLFSSMITWSSTNSKLNNLRI